MTTETCMSSLVLCLNVLVRAGVGLKGRRQLTTGNFEIRDNGDGGRYAKMTHQEATKNHQSGEIEKENFEHELNLVKISLVCYSFISARSIQNAKCFSTYGINTLAKMMKEISQAASLP